MSFAGSWADFMARGLVDGSVVFLVALLLWLPFRRRAPAQLGYGLFLLVLLKLALPVQISVPGWLAWLSPGYWLDSALAEPPPAVHGSLAPLPESTPAIGQLPPATGPDIWLLIAWASVVVALLGRFLWLQLRTRRIVRAARPPTRSGRGLDLRDLARRAGVRRRVRFLTTDAVASPAAGGLLSPYVLVPAGLLEGCPIEPLRWVLLHELAHIRRHDLWVSLLQRLVQIAFFFHPLVWAANRIIDEQREFACDDAALAACGLKRRECGKGFLTVVEWAQGRSREPVAALGVFDSNQAIRRRLMRILDGRGSVGGRTAALCSAFVLAVGLCVLPTVRAQDPTQDLQRKIRQSEIQILRAKIQKLELEQQLLRVKLQELEGRSTGRGGSGRRGRNSATGIGGGAGGGYGSGTGRAVGGRGTAGGRITRDAPESREPVEQDPIQGRRRTLRGVRLEVVEEPPPPPPPERTAPRRRGGTFGGRVVPSEDPDAPRGRRRSVRFGGRVQPTPDAPPERSGRRLPSGGVRGRDVPPTRGATDAPSKTDPYRSLPPDSRRVRTGRQVREVRENPPDETAPEPRRVRVLLPEKAPPDPVRGPAPAKGTEKKKKIGD